MIRKFREMQEKEEGFTLIELLVVVIIIGILAAIAIPSFLNQRERGWQAELTSAVRNYALEVEAEATQDGGTYPASDGALPPQPAGVADPGSNNVTFTYTQLGGGTGFTLCGVHGSIATAHSVTYDTTLNGIQPFDDANGC